LLEQMIGFFHEETETFLPRMRSALRDGNLVEVGRLGHRLKGCIANIGAEAAREAVADVERFLLSPGEPAAAEHAVDALEHECDAVKRALAAYQPV
jgi:HPt (histidine-containing phosphotransfer) domain-containing protein